MERLLMGIRFDDGIGGERSYMRDDFGKSWMILTDAGSWGWGIKG